MVSYFTFSDSKMKIAVLLGGFLFLIAAFCIGESEGAIITLPASTESTENQTQTNTSTENKTVSDAGDYWRDDGTDVGDSDTEGTQNNDTVGVCEYNATAPLGMTDLGVESVKPADVASTLSRLWYDGQAMLIAASGGDPKKIMGVVPTWRFGPPTNKTKTVLVTDYVS